jgi:riboflavin synthase
MFTGIITDIGEIASIDDSRGDVRFGIKTSYDLLGVDIGASIACAGCCLTVVEMNYDDHIFYVDVSKESIDKTNLSSWSLSHKINLERSLKLGDELGGHWVTGHVDAVAKLISSEQEGDSHRLKIEVPQEFAKFIAPKGSVTLDGISLTVNEVDGNVFGVNIIPHTWDVTTFGKVHVGDKLNLEVDIMARYAARLFGSQLQEVA